MDVFGLLGNPVGHSLSPPMHEAAYDELGTDARYVTFEPAPDDLEAAIEGAQALGITGLNVTIPFKQDALAHVEPDDLAARIGAVNTIDFPDGDGDDSADDPPTGHNTDAAGVRRSFSHHDVTLADRDAVVVGAGGAARAAVFALADAGATVHVANRTVERAERLVADLGGASDDDAERATAGSLDSLETRVPAADVLVNATSVGMEEDRSPVPAETLHGDLAVLDAVYRPLDTRLLREARERGATTIDGAWMLLYQGVEAFELWTGRDAPVNAMNEALRARL
ncbi:shikimate dehydrogenase [Halorussus gelatinilyticus]|uniref:Shikimate dehydrogenase (NADP(+)) n=1 Tax=Halorussus gelatinilyticus TaxID=2937524 RepID=A0A8U0IFW1_9EURY|nr:shikimate dehydrogenase [Halorussus gelatinilyticus]UPV99163.1 shikimate dehydrogenase [Halorussus gelatinilyticus]